MSVNQTTVNASSSPVVQTRNGNGSSAANVQIAGDINLRSTTVTTANSGGSGTSGGLVGVGIVTTTANMRPIVFSNIGTGSAVRSTQGSVSLQTLFNPKTDNKRNPTRRRRPVARSRVSACPGLRPRMRTSKLGPIVGQS